MIVAPVEKTADPALIADSIFTVLLSKNGTLPLTGLPFLIYHLQWDSGPCGYLGLKL